MFIISFENHELTITIKNKKQLIDEICIAAYKRFNNIFEFPDYITDIDIFPSKKTMFSQIWVGYVEDIREHQIRDIITKKEHKLTQYKANTNINEQGLLIVCKRGDSRSYDIEHIEEMNFISKFERVYLLESLSSELKRMA
jgi:hypothetical protein